MTSRILKSVAGLALLFAVAVSGLIFLTAGSVANAHNADRQERSESGEKKLEGTWRVQVTLHDCQTGAVLRNFPALLTFAEGGTLTETTTAFPPAARTPGHGFWRRTGRRTYKAVTEAFLFNPAGTWTGTQRLTQAIEIGNDPDELTSKATNEIFDINGNLLMSGCATAVAHRFE
jgi:hypothetical protein